jgi:hypothetical protein
MAEVDTSIYKNAISQNPMDVAAKAADYQNKLLGNVQGVRQSSRATKQSRPITSSWQPNGSG